MTDDPISRIEAALEAGPTPGPWKSSGDVTEGGGPLFVATMAYEGDERRIVARIENRESARPLDNEDFANAAMIAACSPDRISRLLAEVEQLREALTEANAEAEHFKRLWHMFAASVDRLRRENMALRSLPDKPHIVLDKDSLDWLDAAGEPMRKEGGE